MSKNTKRGVFFCAFWHVRKTFVFCTHLCRRQELARAAEICYTALQCDVKELRYKEKKGRRVKSVLEKEKKNGSIRALLLFPDTHSAPHISLRGVTP